MPKIPILMYHHVAEVPRGLRDPRLSNLYVPPAAFAAQMRMLGRLGFVGVSMTQAQSCLRGQKRARVAVITLDDGYVDNLHNALPILSEQGFTATCYVVNAARGGYNHWDEARSGVREPLMTTAQLRQWQMAGMEVGAHTQTHPHLTQCDDTALLREVRDCKAELEDALGTAVPQFCYPFGDHDGRVVKVVREAGFTDATTTRRGRASSGGNPWRWPRIAIKHDYRLPKVALRVLTDL